MSMSFQVSGKSSHPQKSQICNDHNNDKWRRGQHNRISTLIFMQFSLHNFALVIHAYRFKIKIILTNIICKIVFLCKIMWYVVMQITVEICPTTLFIYGWKITKIYKGNAPEHCREACPKHTCINHAAFSICQVNGLPWNKKKKKSLAFIFQFSVVT